MEEKYFQRAHKHAVKYSLYAFKDVDELKSYVELNEEIESTFDDIGKFKGYIIKCKDLLMTCPKSDRTRLLGYKRNVEYHLDRYEECLDELLHLKRSVLIEEYKDINKKSKIPLYFS